MNAFLNRGEYGLLPYLEVKTVSAGDKQVIKLFHAFDCCDMFYCFLVIFSLILSWTYLIHSNHDPRINEVFDMIL